MAETSPRKLLILDLDETLIHVPDAPLALPGDFLIGNDQVYHRPHLQHFLTVCRQWFEIAVWSSGSPEYVALTVEQVFADLPLAFIWDDRRCTRRSDPEMGTVTWRKNLSKVTPLGYSLASVIAVDDSPEKWETGYGNLVRVTPFLGDPHDDELLMLLMYLDELRHHENIRAVEKRGWKNRVATRKDPMP